MDTKHCLFVFLVFVFFLSCQKNRDEPLPTEGNIEGQVYALDSEDKLSIVSNAEIDFASTAMVSDSFGKFVLENVKEGEYELEVFHPKYYSKKENIEIIAGKTVKADIILTPSPAILNVTSERFTDSLTLDFDSSQTQLSFQIINTGGENLLWSIEEDASWLSVDKEVGTNASIITISVDRNQLTSFEDLTNIIITNTATNDKISLKAKVHIGIETQLKKGLLAYYPFNGNANDESGNDYHGVNSGAELTTDRHGHLNSAYDFDGTDIIDIPKHDKINFLDRFSFSVWVKAGTVKTFMYILNKSNNVAEQDLVLKLNHNNYPHFSFRNHVSESHVFNANKRINIDEWVNIIFTRDESKVQKIYINSVLQGVKFETNKIDWISSSLAIGDLPLYNHGGLYVHGFLGVIDDLRIYDRVLLEDEINYLYEH